MFRSKVSGCFGPLKTGYLFVPKGRVASTSLLRSLQYAVQRIAQ
jgi:hypothetical protein